MIITQLYRETLEQLQAEGMANGESTSSTVDVDQIPLLTILFQEGVFALQTIVPSTEGAQLESSNPSVSFRITYGGVDLENITRRLEELGRFTGEHPDYLNGADGRTVILSRGDGFVSYGNRLITHKGEVLHMSYQQTSVLAALMDSYKNYCGADSILDAAGYAGDKALDDAERNIAASKILEPVKKILTDRLGFSPISRQRERGWILDFTPPATE